MNSGRLCTRCVMDESDSAITFDSDGVCSHCRHFDSVVQPSWHPDETGATMWREAVARLRADRGSADYDCVIGLSGGLDSSQLVMLAASAGLNPLIVHVDGGWNSELAVGNIERVLDATGFDLFTVVVDWESMRDLQLAYLRAGVINQDVPQDHAFISGLFQVARRFEIKDIISGHNIATESVLPLSWGFPPSDTRNLLAIYKRFGGGRPLAGYPLMPTRTWLRTNSPMPMFRFVQPLNWLPYDKNRSIADLSQIGWRPYPRKHGESRFTVFYQEYLLPTRYGIDKRRAHYSSLVLAGQLTRAEALEALTEPMVTPVELAIERDFFCRKMRIEEAELDAFLTLPHQEHSSLPNLTIPTRRLKRLLGRSQP